MHHKIYDTDDKGNTTVWAWTPQQDISTYELALCLPAFSTRVDSGTQGHSIAKLPDYARRHFTQVG